MRFLPSYNTLLSEGKYLAAMAATEAEKQTASADRARYLTQRLAWCRTYCGDDLGAIAMYDSGRGIPAGKLPPPERSTDIRLRDAREEILKRAENHRVIILNEAHHVPRHRAFGASLLPGLRRLGFTYFAAETFDAPEKLQASLARRVVTRNTGTYTDESVFASYVNSALNMGFTPVAYEYEGESNPDDPVNTRDAGQATNLYERIFKKEPKAKVLIHVGFNHATRSPETYQMDGKMFTDIWLAGRLTKLLGFPLLTIDQTSGTEASTRARESPRLRGILDRADLRRPSLVQDKNGSFVKDGIGEDCDLTVFHPRVRLRDGRPDWLFTMAGRKAVPLPASIASPKTGRLLVQAFAEGGPGDAVDIDRFVLTANAPRPVFVLPRGRYQLQVQDEEGNVSDAGRLSV